MFQKILKHVSKILKIVSKCSNNWLNGSKNGNICFMAGENGVKMVQKRVLPWFKNGFEGLKLIKKWVLGIFFPKNWTNREFYLVILKVL